MTYKFTIEESPKPCELRMYVYTQDDHGSYVCTDIMEGPYRFIINSMTAYYTDELRLRKV